MTKKIDKKECPFCKKIFLYMYKGQKFCCVECCYLSKVTKDNGENNCYDWIGSKHKFGYGDFRYNHKYYRAHVFSYDFYIGGRMKGEHVLHKCDNPSCSNPNHLFIGSHKINMEDMAKKCRNGNRKLTNEEVYQIRDLIAYGFSQNHIAPLYNVSRSVIASIKNKRNYKYLKRLSPRPIL